eukprot:7446748-Pyramimonas_sp.AAC.1
MQKGAQLLDALALNRAPILLPGISNSANAFSPARRAHRCDISLPIIDVVDMLGREQVLGGLDLPLAGGGLEADVKRTGSMGLKNFTQHRDS